MPEIQVDWKVPLEGAPEATRLAWMNDCVRQGRKSNESQAAWPDIKKARNVVAGIETTTMPSYRSNVRANIPKRQIREVVSTVSDLRLMGGFKTDNRELYKNNEVINKLIQAWYLNTFADRKIRKTMQYAAVGGTGYARPIWKMDMWYEGRGDIDIESYGPEDVGFVQLPRDGNFQRAYAVWIHQAVPVAMMCAMFPNDIAYIKPDRYEMGTIRRGLAKVQKFLAPALNLRSTNEQDTTSPVCDVYHTYILDMSINNTGKPIPMGADTSWPYTVPFLGQDIPSGRDKLGNQLFRKAEAKDCRMYPTRRLMVATPSHIFYDGPNDSIDPRVPLVKFTVDDWPEDYLGFPLTHDTGTMSDTHTAIMRGMADRLNVKPQPPLAYDTQGTAKADMEKLDTRRPNQKLGIDFQRGEMPKQLLTPEYFTISADEFTFLNFLESQMGKQLALDQVESLAKAKLNIGSEGLDKLLEMAGPVVKDISRNMEEPVCQLADMVKCLMFQYYTLPRRVQILGADGLTEEDYDYEPGNMIPSHTPEEFGAAGKDAEGNQKMPTQESMSTLQERARAYCNNFFYHQTPNSLHKGVQMTQKMLLIQLASKGIVPIDPWTLAEICDVPNYGPPPKGATTVMEKWMAWKDIQMEMAKEASQGMEGAGTRGPKGGQKGTGGRAPAGATAPHVETRDGGARSFISESK